MKCQILLSNGDNLHAMSNPVFLGKIKENISKCCLLKILARLLSIKENMLKEGYLQIHHKFSLM